MTEKLSGMEMMLNSLLKAAGFDPSVIRKNIEDAAGSFKGAIDALASRLDAIDNRMAQIDARLQRIEIAMDIAPENGESDKHAPRQIAAHKSE